MPTEQTEACPYCGRELQSAQGGVQACPECQRPLFPVLDADSGRLEAWIPGDLGRFCLLAAVGRGGMGRVFKGQDKQTGQPVAIKFPLENRAWDTHARSRFEREIALLQAIDHPNIVRYLAHGVEADRLYYVMEWVEGADVGEVLKDCRARGETLPFDYVHHCFQQLCRALQTLHDHGIVHRDVKPSNIIVTAKRAVKLIDLGIAKSQGTQTSTGTTTTSAVGTYEYLAPEQQLNPRMADHRADIFALGLVTYEMLTGRRPRGTVSKPSAINKTVPESFDQVVLGMMEHEPSARPELCSLIEASEPTQQKPTVRSSSGTSFFSLGMMPMKVVIINVVVFLGFFVGDRLGGFLGSLVAGIGSFLGCLLVAEKLESKRKTTGFWLRYRGDIVCFLTNIVCVIVGSVVVRGFWGIVMGMGAGVFIGGAIVNKLGWGGKSLGNQIGFRMAYLSALSSAANADGTVSEKERQLVISTAKEMFAGLGYGDNADMIPLAECLLSDPPSAAATGVFVSGLESEFAQLLQRDLCKVLFADGELHPFESAWLEQFQASAKLNDWGILSLFSRNPGTDAALRTACLNELGLGPNATKDEIKKAYRELAMQYHPDRQDAVAPHLRDLISKKMAAVNDANRFLTKQEIIGPFFFQNPRGRSFSPLEGTHFECKCWLCSQSLRVPGHADHQSVRCSKCHALAGLNFDPNPTATAHVPNADPTTSAGMVFQAADAVEVTRETTDEKIKGASWGWLSGLIMLFVASLPFLRYLDPAPKPLKLPPAPPFESSLTQEQIDRLVLRVLPLSSNAPLTNSIGMKLVPIPAGKFMMGSPASEKGRQSDEGPQHEVQITKPFYMGSHEVTQEEYLKVMGMNPSYFSAGGEGKDKVRGLDTRSCPVENVSWEEANEFCRKLSALPTEKRAGRSYRLPTEAEWEYACRGMTTSPFHFGDVLDSTQANFDGNYPYGSADNGPNLQRSTHVDCYQPNIFGLHDMHGNVWEWCADGYEPDFYKQSPASDPQAHTPASSPVIRGGSWSSDGKFCRSAYRRFFTADLRRNDIGFRVVTVQSLKPKLPPATKIDPKPVIEPKLPPLTKTSSFSGQELLTFKGHSHYVSSVCFSPDGKRLASASFDNTVKIWEAANGQEILSLEGHTGGVCSVCFSPDGTRLASASYDKTVKIWDAVGGQALLTLKGHTYSVYSVCFSPDGMQLASASHDKTARIWDAASGLKLLTLKGHTYAISSVCFSPDGMRLASASSDKTVKIWDAASGQELLSLKGHTDNVLSVCFSPDGMRLASASHDKTARIWDAVTGQELLSLKGHTDGVLSVCFSPNGKRLASAGDDNTVKIWDASSGQELLTCTGHIGSVFRVCFSPDGKRLASGSYDKMVKIWDAGSGQESIIAPATKVASSAKQITNSIGMQLVPIPKDKFMMGSPAFEKDRDDNEGPQHEVEITKPFHMGVHEVTQEEYEQVMGTNPSHFKGKKNPVETVSYNDVVEFCKKLSALPEEKRAGRIYRLPTEAEWEYACRAGTKTVFHFGDSLSTEQANFDGNRPYVGAAKGKFLERTAPVGSYQPNAFGLYDMHGNVREWCADWYENDYYKDSPRQDPENTKEASSRVIRGGCWNDDGRDCRSAYRSRITPYSQNGNLGFRVVAVQSR